VLDAKEMFIYYSLTSGSISQRFVFMEILQYSGDKLYTVSEEEEEEEEREREREGGREKRRMVPGHKN
jgi:hypothetical protein